MTGFTKIKIWLLKTRDWVTLQLSPVDLLRVALSTIYGLTVYIPIGQGHAPCVATLPVFQLGPHAIFISTTKGRGRTVVVSVRERRQDVAGANAAAA